MAAFPLLSLVAFTIGIILLVEGAEYFVRGGSGLAMRFRVSKALIGFTIISFGTSLPELVVNTDALLADMPEITLGNVLGSNIANIALVLGLAAIVRPAIIKQEGAVRWTSEWALMLGASALFSLLALRGVIDIYAGLILLAGFGFSLFFLWSRRKEIVYILESGGPRDYVYTIGGLIGIILGADLLVQGAVDIARIFGISEFVIGVSLVAIGTSLPELATSLIAVLREEPGISVGNVLGSNVFNLLFVMGVGSFIRPIPVVSYTSVLVMLLFAFLVVPLFVKSSVVTRLFAALLLMGYGFYIGIVVGVLG